MVELPKREPKNQNLDANVLSPQGNLPGGNAPSSSSPDPRRGPMALEWGATFPLSGVLAVPSLSSLSFPLEQDLGTQLFPPPSLPSSSRHLPAYGEGSDIPSQRSRLGIIARCGHGRRVHSGPRRPRQQDRKSVFSRFLVIAVLLSCVLQPGLYL